MEDIKEGDFQNSVSSDSTLDSGKSPPNNDDTIGSCSSFAYKAIASEASTLKNSTAKLYPRSVSRYNESVSKHASSNSLNEITEAEKAQITRRNMTTVFVSIYGILLTATGAVIYVNHQSSDSRHVSEVFSTSIAAIGMAWLIFLHLDLYRYKRQIFKNIIVGSHQMDKISTITDFNMAATFIGNENPPYQFLRGRHSGSFYLKAGLAVFCFGHLINEGLMLGQEFINFVQEYRVDLGCGDTYSMIHHIIRPAYSFYQLFIVFKYSNIIINRHKVLACFALMHIMASCLCFWFGTILEEALEEYHHDENDVTIEDLKKNATQLIFSDTSICSRSANNSYCICSATAILSVNNVQAIPYLFPFAIEFNILLAGVWFIMWTNIGNNSHHADPHHFHHKVHTNDGIEEVTYHSNLVISADCHASNKGLFAGLFILMTSIISIIAFFVTMSIKEYQEVAVAIHTVQEGALTTLALIGVILGFRQLSQLDYSLNPIHFLDDLLLFVPLPFFFIQATMTIISEFQKKTVMRIFMSVLIPVQVILQTPFLIDGLRRCSNSQQLRYKKPGREIVTFLIICNLTMWIINTFEAKSVESHYGLHVYFGKYVWMFVSHATLPLMLFYRFHSSACLADIWKSAYNKEE
ncbi:proton channel OtopLc isoform X2 [Parasteatoda tepidariorum]